MPELPPLAFWLATSTMAAIALAFVVPRLFSGNVRASPTTRASLNISLHRAQLADLARERDEGALSDADYERSRAEVERRLVDEAEADMRAPSRPSRRAAWALVAILPLAAFALYFAFGTPAAFDASTTRPADANPVAYRASLERHLASHPADARSWVLLARASLEADRFADAAIAYEKAIAASPKVARDPDVLCELADAIGMVNGGTLAGRPRELIEKALAIDARNPRALEMAGSVAYERGEFREAAATWRLLLAQIDPGTQPHRELTSAIERADRHARLSLPAAATGTNP